MSFDSTSPVFLSDDDFKTDSATWLRQVMQATDQPKLLDTVFTTASSSDSNNRLHYFGIPAAWLRWLVSTVGCTQIKARFLVNKAGQFALCFYATDAQGKRVSAYYLLNSTTSSLANVLAQLYTNSSTVDKGTVSASDASGAVQIPHGVAGEWISGWQAADTLLPSMFTTRDGILQGYTFERGDLANSLFNIDPAEQQQLRVDFGLHKYYAHDQVQTQPTHTFGLVLRLVNPAATTSDDPFYDMSTPCPPTC